MASNFKMFVKHMKGGVHVKLKGDFDGTSGHQLAHILTESAKTAQRITIETDELRQIHSFGASTFASHLRIASNERVRLIFKGRHARKIAPGRRPSVRIE